MVDHEGNHGCREAAFGERFEFEGHQYIVVSEVADGFVLAVKAEDETPAPIYLLPAAQAGVKRISKNRGQEPRMAGNGIRLWTGGSCLGERGQGGWAYVREEGDGVLACASGSEPDTTMTGMKVRAVIQALNALPQREVPVVVYTDSEPLLKAVTGDAPGNDLALWEQMRQAAAGLSITWHHSGRDVNCPENDRWSRLAETTAMTQARPGGRAHR